MFHFLLSAGLVDSVSLFGAGEGANLLGSAREDVDAAQQAREWQQQGLIIPLPPCPACAPAAPRAGGGGVTRCPQR